MTQLGCCGTRIGLEGLNSLWTFALHLGWADDYALDEESKVYVKEADVD